VIVEAVFLKEKSEIMKDKDLEYYQMKSKYIKESGNKIKKKDLAHCLLKTPFISPVYGKKI
jgi:hypothetical protein